MPASSATLGAPVPCPSCGGATFAPRYPVRDLVLRTPGIWTFARCAGCGHGVLDPLPGDDELAGFYRGLYSEENLATMRRANDSGFDRGLRRRRIDALLQAGLPAEADVLEVGCGLGDFLAELAARLGPGARVRAVELSETAAGAAEARLRATLGPGDRVLRVAFEDAQLAEGTLDLIAMNHVLEHVRDPARTLLRAARLLRPGGLLLVELPRGDGWGPRLLGRWWWPHLPPQHVHLFGRAGLARALERAGFGVVDARVAGYPLTACAGWVAFVRGTVGRDSPRANSLPFRALRWIVGPLGLAPAALWDVLVAPLLARWLGDVLTVVARRRTASNPA